MYEYSKEDFEKYQDTKTIQVIAQNDTKIRPR